ncbi:MAG: hypothetical protein JW807_07685 [Spirochaetes bacterium]|nr:hypothetical protein [Spirochaetota bacterium]
MKNKIILALTILLCASTAWSTTIFVFNPESGTRRIRSAAIGLEDYLKSRGIKAKVQIFTNPVDFKQQSARLKPEYAIVASYFFYSGAAEYGWKPLLSGHRNRVQGFSKILVSGRGIYNPGQLRNKAIATVSLGKETIYFINTQFLQPLGLSVRTVRLVTVSKDIDAIMALGFQQVDGAIVTNQSLASLKRINPTVFNSIKTLRVLPMIAYPKLVNFSNAADAPKVQDAFRRLTMRGKGRDFLLFLGLTGFQ